MRRRRPDEGDAVARSELEDPDVLGEERPLLRRVVAGDPNEMRARETPAHLPESHVDVTWCKAPGSLGAVPSLTATPLEPMSNDEVTVKEECEGDTGGSQGYRCSSKPARDRFNGIRTP